MLMAGLPRPHRRVFAAIALGVLVAHALLLGAIEPGLGGGGQAPPTALQVREVAPPAAVAAAPDVAAPPPAPAPARPTARPARRTRADRAADAAPASADAPAAAASAPAEGGATPVAEGASAVEAVEPVEAVAQAPAAAPPLPAAETGSPDNAAPAAAESAPPTYPTRLPPAATLRYDLQRGRLGGTGELRWQPDGARYALRLDGSVVGLVVLVQASEGTLGPAGLDPLRFTDQRARRPMLAANFDRTAHRVTFSGAPQPAALLAGAQDRLSWMVQLAAIAAADPARGTADARTALQVVGARGDSSVWVFRSLGSEPVPTRAGPVEALHFVREPRGPHDTGVEVWLDPARHHLPVRATMRNGADGEVLELTLKDLSIGG